MTNYYVRKSGSDSNAGTSPATAWLTLGKAMSSGAGPVGGDTIYIGAGIYRETVTAGIASPASLVNVIADVDGSHTGDPGGVIWSAYTTNDTTAAASATVLAMSAKNNFAFQKILFIGGNSFSSCVALVTAGTNITFTECGFVTPRGPVGSATCIYVRAVAGTNHAVVFDRCLLFAAAGQCFYCELPRHTADYDANILIRNCRMIGPIGSVAIQVFSSGSGTGKGGGVRAYNCSCFGHNGNFMVVSDANISTSIPCEAYNNAVFGGGTGLNANVSGQIIEDYNRLMVPTPRTNVSIGAHSVDSNTHAPLVHFGMEGIWGMALREFGTPMDGSPLLGWGGNSPPSVDALNRPRPAGGQSTSAAVGALERHNTAVRETGTVRTGSNSVVIVGPGDHDFQVPVDAVSTTIAVYCHYDSTHAATNKPQIQVVNGTECGVADATATMTAAADTWEQLSLTFTPTAKGIVTLRLISRAAAGGGKAFFDDVSVT